MRKILLLMLLVIPGALWGQTMTDLWRSLTPQQKNDFASAFAMGFSTCAEDAVILAAQVANEPPLQTKALTNVTDILAQINPKAKGKPAGFQAFAVSYVDNYYSTPGNENLRIEAAFNECLVAWSKATKK